MSEDLLQSDVIALNAATRELLMDWFESLNDWAWPVLLAPQGKLHDDRRGLLIKEITDRLGEKILWRPNRVKWHADIPQGKSAWLFDSTQQSKEAAYVDIARRVNTLNVAKNYNLVVCIDDLKPGRSSWELKIEDD